MNGRARTAFSFVLLLLIVFTTGASQAARSITVRVGGQALALEPPPLLAGGRVLVPLRGVLESLGAQVDWRAAEKRVTVRLGPRLVELTPGRDVGLVDGVERPLDAPARLVQGRLFIPLRFVSEAVGGRVEWQPAASTVLIEPPARPGRLPHRQYVPVEAPAGPYDVLVVGGEPEGVAAAVAAARAGASVLLLEKRPGLGGLLTFGGLNSLDMNYGPHGEILTRGVFSEFYAAIGGDSFDVGEARQALLDLVLAEPRVTLVLESAFVAPVMATDGKTIVGVQAEEGGRRKTYYARRVVDATQDADVAAAAGAPFTVGGEDIGLPDRRMAATLVLHVGGVDWEMVRQALNGDGDPSTGANQVSAWGFLREMQGYRASTPRIRLRGLNLGRQRDGSVLINAMHIFGVDGLNPASRAEALALGRAEAPLVVEHLRARVPGFAGAYLLGTADELYVRETRHLVGEYVLGINDVLENRDFPDQVAIGSYPVDIQPTAPDNQGYVLGKPVMYAIPYRSLVPLQVENLLVVGRSASYSSLAAGSARVVPLGMATGQAAGVAAAYSLEHGLSPRALAYRERHMAAVQEILRRQGAYLQPFSYPPPELTHWAYPRVRSLRALGVVASGYSNSLRLEEPMPAASFVHTLAEALRRLAPGRAPGRGEWAQWEKAEPIWPEDALRFLARNIYREDLPGASPGGYYDLFARRGWLADDLQARWPAGRPLNRGEGLALVADTLRQLGLLSP